MFFCCLLNQLNFFWFKKLLNNFRFFELIFWRYCVLWRDLHVLLIRRSVELRQNNRLSQQHLFVNADAGNCCLKIFWLSSLSESSCVLYNVTLDFLTRYFAKALTFFTRLFPRLRGSVWCCIFKGFSIVIHETICFFRKIR